jgi:cation diffusion facilitator CzcD-associated flavoprotein CzcO
MAREERQGTGGIDSIVIVGSGFAGLLMAIRLKQEGIEDFVILERSDQLGGVWRDNHYPGVACDVPAHLYSYSFEPNPRWTRFFAPQREILAYLRHCADKYGILPHIKFDSAVEHATFDDASGTWTVRSSRGESFVARVLVSGSGHALSKPVIPDIPGLASFGGKTMHSARWDDSFSLAGKRVAVIGTGASAIQIIPAIAPVVGHLSVFQRTAPWVMPRPDHAIPPWMQDRFEKSPWTQRFVRGAIYGLLESMAVGFIVDPRINGWREQGALEFLAKKVQDPELKKKLTPTFRLGCKRILFSNDYYPALVRPNAELVTEPIERVTAGGIVTKDGRERALDAIVLATGFEAAEAKPPFPIAGKGGLTLEQAWKDGIEAYYGCTVSGFPNLFMLIGPNTGLGHSSMIHMMESQAAYVLDAIKTIRERKLSFVDVRHDEQRAFNERIQERLEKTVWATGGCASWYKTKDGKNTTLWPGFTFEFRWKTRKFDVERYEVVPRQPGSVATRGPENGARAVPA